MKCVGCGPLLPAASSTIATKSSSGNLKISVLCVDEVGFVLSCSPTDDPARLAVDSNGRSMIVKHLLPAKPRCVWRFDAIFSERLKSQERGTTLRRCYCPAPTSGPCHDPANTSQHEEILHETLNTPEMSYNLFDNEAIAANTWSISLCFGYPWQVPLSARHRTLKAARTLLVGF